jgi:hypothetical protein
LNAWAKKSFESSQSSKICRSILAGGTPQKINAIESLPKIHPGRFLSSLDVDFEGGKVVPDLVAQKVGCQSSAADQLKPPERRTLKHELL